MQANDYQKKTIETAIYPGAGTGNDLELYYLAMGVTSEAGEIAGKVKKLLRDNKLNVGELAYEIGDVCWYVARLADALGYDFEDILEINYTKLIKRKNNDTIQGNGDNR